MTLSRFRGTILDHYRKSGRQDMPWRKTYNPYHILVSEIMLQQTQVARVSRFYPGFIKRFPNFHALARTKTAVVLRAWQGMGYNRRALALQKLSRIVLEQFDGKLPRGREELEKLPGIGKATSGSLRAFVWNEPEVFIETNIRRVFIHFFFPQKSEVTDEELQRYIKRTLDEENPREWYWALMDYGAMLGKSNNKILNPNRKSAHYRKQPPFKGSDRALRAEIIKLLLKKRRISLNSIVKITGEHMTRVEKISSALTREGFTSFSVQNSDNYISL